MVQQVDQVFLASRFGEFSDLRSALTKAINANRQPKLKVINLDDGAVTSFPPLKECLLHVKNSNFFILLLGDEYGSIPNGHEKSYTHQEYKEAYKNELETRILVFCIGESYSNNRIHYSENPTMAQWQRDLEDRHTIGFFSKPTSVEEAEQLAEKITYQLLNTVYDRYFGQVQFDDDFSPDDSDVDENDIYGEENEIDKLENLDRSKSADTQSSERSSKEEDLFNYLTIVGPSKEAKEALELGEKSIAVKLFERIIDNRPLDILSNYWLAKLYLSVGGKKYLKKSVELSTRAAKASAIDGSNIRTSSAYQIASKASAELGNFEEAKYYAETSIEFAKNYAKAYVQKARVIVMENPKNRDEIKNLLENAINIHSGIISELFNDPLFKRHRDLIKSLHDRYLQRRLNKLTSIVEVENDIIKLSNLDEYSLRPSPTHAKAYYDTINDSLGNQISILKTLGGYYLQALIEMGKNPHEEMQTPVPVEARKYFEEPTELEYWYVSIGDIVYPEDRLFRYENSNGRSKTYRWLGKTPIRITDITDMTLIMNGDILFEYVIPSDEDTYPDLENNVEDLKNELDKTNETISRIEKNKNIVYYLVSTFTALFFIGGIGYAGFTAIDDFFAGMWIFIAITFLGAKLLQFIKKHWESALLKSLLEKKPDLLKKYNEANEIYLAQKSVLDKLRDTFTACVILFENNLSSIPAKNRSNCKIKSLDEKLYTGDYVIVKDEEALHDKFQVLENILFNQYLDYTAGKTPIYKVVGYDKKTGINTLSRDLSYFDMGKSK